MQIVSMAEYNGAVRDFVCPLYMVTQSSDADEPVAAGAVGKP